MSLPTSYNTITEEAEGFLKDRGSKFFAFAYPVRQEDDIQHHLLSLRKTHFKARHHCYAWRLGYDHNNFRANDDGEPSGTGGRPILSQIDKNDLTNILIVVIRYFGGTLLGTSGLIHAYGGAAAEAIDHAHIITKPLLDWYKLSFDYAHMGDTMNAVKSQEIEIIEQHFDQEAYLILGIPYQAVDKYEQQLKAQILKIPIEQAAIDEWPSTITFTLYKSATTAPE